MSLKGRVALVTGGAHRVGKAIALALAADGADVVVHYGKSHDKAQQTVSEIEALGCRSLALSGDLADPQAIQALFSSVHEAYGQLDILVNSAATFEHSRFEQISLEQWDRAINVNLRAPFLCMQHAARLMRGNDGERAEPAAIINIADLSGEYPWVAFASHGVSKAGLIHLTRIAAHELAPDVRVNALVLGPVIPSQGMHEDSPGWQRSIQALPLKKAVGLTAVADAARFLVGNSGVTGAVLHVDSGENLIGPAKHLA